MDSRQQFEEWYSKKGKHNYLHLDLVDDEYIFRSGIDKSRRGEYVHEPAQDQWDSWQASRESLVINLPVMPKAQRSDEEATFSAGGCDMLSKCIKSIEAAGLKVTP